MAIDDKPTGDTIMWSQIVSEFQEYKKRIYSHDIN